MGLKIIGTEIGKRRNLGIGGEGKEETLKYVRTEEQKQYEKGYKNHNKEEIRPCHGKVSPGE